MFDDTNAPTEALKMEQTDGKTDVSKDRKADGKMLTLNAPVSSDRPYKVVTESEIFKLSLINNLLFF